MVHPEIDHQAKPCPIAPGAAPTSRRAGRSVAIFLRRRRIRLVFMALLQNQLGLYNGILAPAVPELQSLLHVDFGDLNSALMFQFLGVLLGSLMAAYVCDVARRHADLVLFAASIAAGLLNVAAPWAPNITVLGLMYCLAGVCKATIDTVCSMLTMLEWAGSSGAAMNFLYLFFPLGRLLAPLTTEPFLSRPRLIGLEENMTQIFYNSTLDTDIFIPFGFHGALGVLTAMPFVFFYIFDWNYKKVDASKGIVSIFAFDDKFALIVAVIAFFLAVTMNIRDNVMSLLNLKIAVNKPLNFTKQQVELYEITYDASWCLSRIYGVLISKNVQCRLVIFGVIVLAIVDNLFLLVLGFKSKIHYWIVSCAFPLVAGQYYPTMLAWINDYVPASGALVAGVVIGLGVGGFISDLVSGYLYKQYGAYPIFGEMLAASTFIFLLSFPIQVFFVGRGHRFQQDDPENDSRRCVEERDKTGDSVPLMTTL